jgi:hypothetical protein
MELLLGVPPLSQYDLYATDMRDYFTSHPDLTPYTSRPPAVAAVLNPSADTAPNPYLRRARSLMRKS